MYCHTLANKETLTRKAVFPFAWRFGLYSAVGVCLVYLTPADKLVKPLLGIYATLVGGLLESAALPVVVSGQKVVLPGTFGIDIVTGCSGVPHLVLFLSALLAYPTSNISKLYGAILAASVIFVGNILRLFSLFWVGVYAQHYFDVAHLYVWGVLSYIGLALLWMFWLFFLAIPRQKHAIRISSGS